MRPSPMLWACNAARLAVRDTGRKHPRGHVVWIMRDGKPVSPSGNAPKVRAAGTRKRETAPEMIRVRVSDVESFGNAGGWTWIRNPDTKPVARRASRASDCIQAAIARGDV